MKPTTYTFDIPTPCHEKWNSMDKRTDGRFCHSCQKTVVDFSQKTDRQVAAHFQKINGNVCGKFRKDQLQRPVHFEQPNTFGGKLRALGLLVPGLLAGGVANAQITESHPTEQLENHPSEMILGWVAPQTFKQVKGKVSDPENGEPLISTTILLKGTSIGTTTDIHGSYQLNVPMPLDGSPIVLEISYTGFTTKEIALESNVPEENIAFVEVKLETSGYLLGDIIIIKKDQTLYNNLKHKFQNISYNIRSIIKAKRKEKAAKKETIKKEDIIFETPENNSDHLIKKENNYSGKIFPNPFFNNINIEINCPKNELLTIRLIDLNGRIIFSQKQDAVEGENTITLSPDLQNISTSNYMLEVNGNGGLYFAEMVVYSSGN